MPLGQLDLELDSAEERRGRREREPVDARRELVAEPRAAVGAGLRPSDHLAASGQLDATPGAGRPAPVSSTCVESEAVAIGSES